LATKSESVGLIVCAISFQDFQPMWSQITNITDRQTTSDHKTALCTKVHCAVKMLNCKVFKKQCTSLQLLPSYT